MKTIYFTASSTTWTSTGPTVSLGAGAPLLPHRFEFRLEELARNGDFACARYSVVR